MCPILKDKSIEERKALSIIEMRDYNLIEREKEEDNIIRFIVGIDGKKRGKISCIINERVVGVAFVREMQEKLQERGLEKGIMIANVKFTWAAEGEAKRSRKDKEQVNIELIPKRVPPFNIFDHELVPKHEILPPEKAEELLEEYGIEAHQLPRIKSSDVVMIGLGAKPGDIIKITRDSPTAGKHVAYRLVIIDPEAKVKI